ncbi:MAG: MqnA/MqnD/SBP family protein [Arcobacteraceae bacterium]
MIFAKIDFINLLPFYVFIKKNIHSSQLKQIFEYKKSYPSAINKKFIKRQIDAAFISSIASRGAKSLDIGIVAQNEVLSVLAVEGKYEKDYQSDTSNALAKVLGVEGKIIIGDKALQYYHNNKDEKIIDLAQKWRETYDLPFVFARLCFNKDEKILRKLVKEFVEYEVKIPQYILKQYMLRSGLSAKQIKEYLSKISYKISYKEKRSLKLFFKLAKKQGI